MISYDLAGKKMTVSKVNSCNNSLVYETGRFSCGVGSLGYLI